MQLCFGRFLAPARAGVASTFLGLAAVSWLACAHAPKSEETERQAPLRLAWVEPARGVAVRGELDGREALVRFDTASPLTTVSAACFQAPPRPLGSVSVRQLDGSSLSLVEVQVGEAGAGGRRLFGRRRVGLSKSTEPGCVVTVGADELVHYALGVDAGRKEVTVALSRPRAAYDADVRRQPGARAVDLSLHPGMDWPLLAVRLHQGARSLLGPLLVSTATPFTELGDAPLQASGWLFGDALLEALGQAGPPPAGFDAARVEVSRAELSPQAVQVWPSPARVAAGWKSALAMGRLGADWLGHLQATVDLGARVLLLPPEPSPPGASSPAHPEGASGLFQAFRRRLEAEEKGAPPARTPPLAAPQDEPAEP